MPRAVNYVAPSTVRQWARVGTSTEGRVVVVSQQARAWSQPRAVQVQVHTPEEAQVPPLPTTRRRALWEATWA